MENYVEIIYIKEVVAIDILKLFETRYYHEIDQKEKINSRVSIPLGVVTFLIASLGYFLKDINKLPDATWVGYYKVCLVGYIIFILLSVVLLSLAYYGYEYWYLASPMVLFQDLEKIKKYYDENYEEYFSENTDLSKEELINIDFKNHIQEQYLKATEQNIKLNAKKLILLRWTGWSIIISVVIGAITYVILNFNY